MSTQLKNVMFDQLSWIPSKCGRGTFSFPRWMMTAIWFFIQAGSGNILFGQNNSFYADSLKAVLSHATQPKDSMLTLRQLARYYMRYDLKVSKDYTQLFQEKAMALGDSYQVAVADHYFGLVNRLESNYSDALKYFHKALDHFEKDTSTLANRLGPLFNIGVIYQTIGDFDNALQYFYAELEVRDKARVNSGYGNTLNSIGVTLKKMGNYAQALDIYQQALTKSLEAGDSIDLSNIYNNRGSVRELMGDYQGARDDYQKSLAIDLKDGYASGIASSYESISKIHLKSDRIDSARYYAIQAYEIRTELGQLRELIESAHNMVEISLRVGNIDDAWMYAEITTPKCNELGVPELVMYNYALLADIYRMKGETGLESDALRSQLVWKDSLSNRQALETARNLQVRYETTEKERALASLQKENDLNNLLISRQRKWQFLLLLASGLLLFLLILSIRFYQLKIEAHQLKADQEQLIKEQKHREVEAKNKMLQMNAMLQGQEVERIRIAKDLHDGLGALLSSVKLHFESVQNEFQALTELNLYKKTNDLLDNACTEVRRIAHNMMPAALSKLGLIQALEDLIEGLRLKGKRVSFETINMDQPIPEEIELMVYRIIQELINNISRHANATRIIVQLSIHDHQLFVSVEDDGCGFNTEQNSDGIGLKNMRSRVAYLGGSIEIESVEKIGTTTSVVIPLPVYSMAAS